MCVESYCQWILATHSLKACPEQGSLHRAGDSRWQWQSWLKPSMPTPWCDPSSEAGTDSSQDPHFLPRQPLAMAAAPKAAFSHANLARLSVTAAARAKQLWVPHPRQGRHLPRGGKTGKPLGMAAGLPFIPAGAATPGPALQLQGPHCWWSRVSPPCDHPTAPLGRSSNV